MKVVIAADDFALAAAFLKAVSENSPEAKQTISVAKLVVDQDCRLIFFSSGVRASYTFKSVTIQDPGVCFLDLETVISLKLGKVSEIIFEIKDKLCVISTSVMQISLPFACVDEVDKEDADKVQYLPFKATEFMKALSYHIYGSHHNPEEASRRPVRLISSKGQAELFSCDKQVSAFSYFESGIESDLNLQFLPAPLLNILSVLKVSDFQFGLTKTSWKLKTDIAEVCFPNLIRKVDLDLTSVVKSMEESPCNYLEINPRSLDRALSQLGVVFKAKDAVKVTLQVYGGDRVFLLGASEKVKDARVELTDIKISAGSISGRENLIFNYKYLKEFVSTFSPDGESFILQWWEYMSSDAPLKGKAFSLYNSKCRYIMARLAI